MTRKEEQLKKRYFAWKEVYLHMRKHLDRKTWDEHKEHYYSCDFCNAVRWEDYVDGG